MTSNTMSADALPPPWVGANSRVGIGIPSIQIPELELELKMPFQFSNFFTIHLKFIPPTAKTSFKPNFELDNGYIPWFFSFYFLVIDICPNNGEIALLTN